MLTCNFGDLAAKASVTVRVSGTTSAAVCGTVPNTATVAATNEPGDKRPTTAALPDVVVNCPDLKVTKDADNSPISAGETASFTIKVENIGQGTAYDVTLTDTLPDRASPGPRTATRARSPSSMTSRSCPATSTRSSRSDQPHGGRVG